MSRNIYVLGTGLSHNGSAVLLKNGQVAVAIEKERISRIKHDGGNDNLAIQYCLDAEGIQLQDVDLAVQCANFELPERAQYQGRRLFADSNHPPLVDISHHLAHAYSAAGTCPFQECMVMVIDGCGSPLEQYLQLHPEEEAMISNEIKKEIRMQCEKESFYYFDGQKLKPLWKDFSVLDQVSQSPLSLPNTLHSIGGFYATISRYVFGNMDDVGKLMGLAPFGKSGHNNTSAFSFQNGRLTVLDDWKSLLTNPSTGYEHFIEHFEEYANVAKWAQEQVEEAVLQCMQRRLNDFPHQNLCFSGGVALNAVANTKLIEEGIASRLYFEPAAADNGLALGCAYYGWLEYLKQPKQQHDGSTCFGKNYTEEEIREVIQQEETSDLDVTYISNHTDLFKATAQQLNEGKTVGWFQSGSEFGPRALGRRSILAHPGIKGLKDHINRNIKFREDFRPFAPAVLERMASIYFESGRKSPYMIQIDRTKTEYLSVLQNVTHTNGSARVQTVTPDWSPKFHGLLEAFYNESGCGVLLNTSFNKKGMPMVETPKEALSLFKETALDLLVIENFIFKKR